MNRVLHIVGRMDRAGAETMVMNLYREIDRSQFQFDFVYFTADRCDYDDEIEALGGRIHRISASNPLARWLALRALLKAGSWRIVHSHTLFSSGLHLSAARLAGVPQRIAHSHSTNDANGNSALGRIYQRLSRRMIGWASTDFVACGIATGEYLFPGKKNVVIIPNSVDIRKFAEASGERLREELGIDPGQLVVLQVGRFMPVKNHKRSVEIAAALRLSGINFQLLMVGTGPEQERIRSYIDELKLSSQVKMLGLRTDIPELMAAADVMLMPSFHEGFPVVLVEAQAGGLPSVVSSEVSPEVDLGLELTSFVSLEASSEEWVEALLKVSKTRVPSSKERTAVLEKAGFSSAGSARLLEKVYRQL